MDRDALLTNASGTVNFDIIDWEEEQEFHVAIRDVPMRTAGPKVDVNHFLIKPKVISLVIRLSTTEKATLETIKDANLITTFSTNDGVWSYDVWIRHRKPRWVYRKIKGPDLGGTDGTVRDWEINIELVVQSGGKV